MTFDCRVNGTCLVRIGNGSQKWVAAGFPACFQTCICTHFPIFNHDPFPLLWCFNVPLEKLWSGQVVHLLSETMNLVPPVAWVGISATKLLILTSPDVRRMAETSLQNQKQYLQNRSRGQTKKVRVAAPVGGYRQTLYMEMLACLDLFLPTI